jgi:hypothetical protein
MRVTTDQARLVDRVGGEAADVRDLAADLVDARTENEALRAALRAARLPHDADCVSRTRGMENACSCLGGIDRSAHNAAIDRALSAPSQAPDVVQAGPFVWWLSWEDQEAIGAAPETWPAWLRAQFDSRRGRPARGRLWVEDHFGDVSINPWPDTPLARRAENCGGIVIGASELHLVAFLPGFVTDMQLRALSPAAVAKVTK